MSHLLKTMLKVAGQKDASESNLCIAAFEAMAIIDKLQTPLGVLHKSILYIYKVFLYLDKL
jgi:hypothetical protein